MGLPETRPTPVYPAGSFASMGNNPAPPGLIDTQAPSSFFPMFNSLKDTMTAKAVQVYVNGRVARYGQLSALKIDSREKTMEITGLLHGDPLPVVVRVTRYVVETAGEKTFISVKDISCSRPWLQNLLEDFVRDRRTELPAWAANAL